MMNRKISKWAIVGIVLVLVILVLGIGCVVMKRMNQKPSDIAEIHSLVDDYQTVFKSERGFGNDRIDVYSFSLKVSDAKELETDWHAADSAFEERYTKYFLPLLQASESSDAKVKELQAKIDLLRQAKELKYRYIEQGGTSKLYMYSPSANTGYCLLVTI